MQRGISGVTPSGRSATSAPSTAAPPDILALLQRGMSSGTPSTAPVTPTAAVGTAGRGAAAAAAAAGPAVVGPDGYGILGLLGVIRTPDRDLNVLALGTDLTTLNLNLNTSEPLHASFAHPWSEVPAAKEPSLALPSTFKVPQPALKTGHFGKFSVGTLVYIFYSMPRDVLQAYSAQELYTREWRYHKDSKLWFKRDGGTDVAPQFVYWDIGAWDRRQYTGLPAPLVAGFLAEEEVRIRNSAAAAASSGGGAGAPRAP